MKLATVVLSTLVISAPVAFAGGGGGSSSKDSRSDAQFRNSQMKINDQMNGYGCGNCRDSRAPSVSKRPKSRSSSFSERRRERRDRDDD